MWVLYRQTIRRLLNPGSPIGYTLYFIFFHFKLCIIICIDIDIYTAYFNFKVRMDQHGSSRILGKPNPTPLDLGPTIDVCKKGRPMIAPGQQHNYDYVLRANDSGRLYVRNIITDRPYRISKNLLQDYYYCVCCCRWIDWFLFLSCSLFFLLLLDCV
jgi:hypothetical protein